MLVRTIVKLLTFSLVLLLTLSFNEVNAKTVDYDQLTWQEQFTNGSC